jgi:hypothetical protein
VQIHGGDLHSRGPGCGRARSGVGRPPAALSALAQLKPTLVLEDATVPRSRIPDMVAAIGQDRSALMI